MQVLYLLYRIVYLWATFSLWHMAGLALLLTVYAVAWFMLTKAAEPVCALTTTAQQLRAPVGRRPGTRVRTRRP